MQKTTNLLFLSKKNMPLIYHKWHNANVKVGVWKIAETADWFLQRMTLSPAEQEELSVLTPRKSLEWLAGRWLLYKTINTPIRKPCIKDEFGKPLLADEIELHISISHSLDLAAVVVADRPVGVDIQYYTPKIARIETKFMTVEESKVLSSDERLKHLHIYWGAKESLYKAYGKKALDFRGHIFVDAFEYNINIGRTQGSVRKETILQEYNIFYSEIDNYALTYCLQNL